MCVDVMHICLAHLSSLNLYSLKTLWLPPAHVWASETTGANLGIRFAALYVFKFPPPLNNFFFFSSERALQVSAYGPESYYAVSSVPNRVRNLLSSPPPAASSLISKSTRLEAYFHTCDELLYMWAHAEDLNTLEFTLMQVVSYIAGPVCISTDFVTCSFCLYRPQDVSADLADEVHASPLETVFVFLTFVSDRLLHIMKPRTRHSIATDWPKSGTCS